MGAGPAGVVIGTGRQPYREGNAVGRLGVGFWAGLGHGGEWMQQTPKRVRVRRAWRTPDAWWAEIEPLLPPRKRHPLGCHNPRVDDRRAMDAIVFRLRTDA